MYICEFFQFHIEIEGKGGWIMGGPKGMLAPSLKLLGGGWPPPPAPPPPPLPTPMLRKAKLYAILVFLGAIRLTNVKVSHSLVVVREVWARGPLYLGYSR